MNNEACDIVVLVGSETQRLGFLDDVGVFLEADRHVELVHVGQEDLKSDLRLAGAEEFGDGAEPGAKVHIMYMRRPRGELVRNHTDVDCHGTNLDTDDEYPRGTRSTENSRSQLV